MDKGTQQCPISQQNNLVGALLVPQGLRATVNHWQAGDGVAELLRPGLSYGYGYRSSARR